MLHRVRLLGAGDEGRPTPFYEAVRSVAALRRHLYTVVPFRSNPRSYEEEVVVKVEPEGSVAIRSDVSRERAITISSDNSDVVIEGGAAIKVESEGSIIIGSVARCILSLGNNAQ